MIYYSSYRRDNTDYRFCTDSRGECFVERQNKSVSDAIKSALHYELGFGGYLKSLTPTCVEIKTPVFNKVDTVIFEADDAQDMVELIRAIACFEMVRGDTKEERVKKLGDMYDKLVEIDSKFSSPLFLVHFSPLVIGSAFEKQALVLYLSETEEDIKLLIDCSVDWLYDLIDLRLNGFSMDDIRKELNRTVNSPDPS